MAEQVKVLREGHAINVSTAFGFKTKQPTSTVSDQRIQSAEHQAVFALPVDSSKSAPLQDFDPNSPTFLLTFFLPGYDIPGDPTKPIRPS